MVVETSTVTRTPTQRIQVIDGERENFCNDKAHFLHKFLDNGVTEKLLIQLSKSQKWFLLIRSIYSHFFLTAIKQAVICAKYSSFVLH